MATLIQSLKQMLETKPPELSVETKRILLKEALQSYALEFLYNHPIYRQLNFYGGTCLRVVYGLNRLSEDIDLDNGDNVDIPNLSEDIRKYFQKSWGFDSITASDQLSASGIRRTTLKFPVLYELDLTSHPQENLHLKVEVSTHKQTAKILFTPLIYYGRSFVSRHFSLESMMAGKMLVCLERSFQAGDSKIGFKSRDFYDLLWFMQQEILPLEDKLLNDGDESYTVVEAFRRLSSVIEDISTTSLSQDLFPLFENRQFIETWVDHFHDNFERFKHLYTRN